MSSFHDYIISNLAVGLKVLEFGSGEGTQLLLDAGLKVVSVEHDKAWLGKVQTDYIYAPIEPFKNKYYREETGWYSLEVLKKELPTDYDLILVDGPPRSEGRGGFDLYFDELQFKRDVPIVFDDVHRLWEFRLMGNIGRKLGRNPVIHVQGDRWFGVV